MRLNARFFEKQNIVLFVKRKLRIFISYRLNHDLKEFLNDKYFIDVTSKFTDVGNLLVHISFLREPHLIIPNGSTYNNI